MFLTFQVAEEALEIGDAPSGQPRRYTGVAVLEGSFGLAFLLLGLHPKGTISHVRPEVCV